MGDYVEGDALCYMIWDDQSQGTEHKWMTDRERMFCKWLEKKGKKATVTQWLDYMEVETAFMLAGTIIHHKGSPGGLKVDPQLKQDDESVFQLCRDAAQCIRSDCEKQYVALNVDLGTQLKNGMLGKNATVPKSPNKTTETLVIPDDND